MILTLTRDTSTPDATLGVLVVPSMKFQTIERPWVPNRDGGKGGEKFVSCVAPGLYRLERFTRPSGEKAFILSNPELDVYQADDDVLSSSKLASQCRTRVLIHIANYVADVVGCIGVGEERKHVNGVWMVTKSKQSMALLRNALGADLDLKLRIVS